MLCVSTCVITTRLYSKEMVTREFSKPDVIVELAFYCVLYATTCCYFHYGVHRRISSQARGSIASPNIFDFEVCGLGTVKTTEW